MPIGTLGLLAIGALVGGLISGVGAIISGIGAQRELEAEEAQLNLENEATDLQEDQVDINREQLRLDTQFNVETIRREQARAVGSQLAATAASGLGRGGSGMEVRRGIVREGNRQVRRQRTNERLGGDLLDIQSGLLDIQRRSTNVSLSLNEQNQAINPWVTAFNVGSGLANAGSSFLTGGANLGLL